LKLSTNREDCVANALRLKTASIHSPQQAILWIGFPSLGSRCLQYLSIFAGRSKPTVSSRVQLIDT
jgi:hypothetical protein